MKSVNPLVAAALLAGCAGMNPRVVEPAEYLAGLSSDPTIYGDDRASSFVAPFDMSFEPLRKILLVNFNDPVYEGIEMQTFDGSDGKEALMLMLYRRDQRVDHYWTANYAMDDEHRRQRSALLNTPAFHGAWPLEYHLTVTGGGLDVAAKIRDVDGREIAFSLKETGSAPGYGAILAPVAARSLEPDAFSLVFMHDFTLVRVKNAQARVVVGGEERAIEKLPVFFPGPRAYLLRYSLRNVAGRWNVRAQATLAAIPVSLGDSSAADGAFKYDLAWTNGHPEIRTATARSGDHAMRLSFGPPLPDLAGLRDGARVDGRFTVDVNEVQGVIAGEYRVQRSGESVQLEIHPVEGWQPPMASGAPWVRSYRWKAQLSPAPDGRLQLKAKWIRANDG